MRVRSAVALLVSIGLITGPGLAQVVAPKPDTECQACAVLNLSQRTRFPDKEGTRQGLTLGPLGPTLRQEIHPHSGLPLFEPREEMLDSHPQEWDIARNGFPYDFRVDLEVPVDEDGPHPDDLGPRDVRRQRADLLGKRPSGFADDLQVPHKPILKKLVVLKGSPATFTVPLDGLDRFEDVAKTLPRVSHTGMASRRTLSRMRDLRPRTVTTSTRQPSRISSSC